jgi:hypothetical protein
MTTTKRLCQRCGTQGATLELRRYPTPASHVAWFCQACSSLNRDKAGGLFIAHYKLRASGIDPNLLPEMHPEKADQFLAETASLWPPSAIESATITRDTRPNGVGEGPLS